jgi:hypothetical protein
MQDVRLVHTITLDLVVHVELVVGDFVPCTVILYH